VIDTLNEKFVSSWVIIDDIHRKIGKEHPELADRLLHDHVYPLDFFFLKPNGDVVTRLTSFGDLRDAHPAVGHPHREGVESHEDVFLGTIEHFFGK